MLTERSTVESFNLREGEVGDVFAHVWEERVVGSHGGGVFAFCAFDAFVVPDYNMLLLVAVARIKYPILGYTIVHFQGGRAID